MIERERLVSLLNEGGKIAGEKVHKSIYDFVKEHHHFSSKKDADKVPSMQELVADYLLENGVILPPCKVGDVVFMLGQDGILEMEVFQKTTGINGSYYDSRNTAYNDFEDIFVDVDIGETVFLTREEAEAALERMKGDDNER